jgi:cobalamin biosynthesis protein CobD/CbiB
MRKEQQGLQNDDFYKRRIRLVGGMMWMCMVIAFIFYIWAASYHIAVFWWIAGTAWTSFGILGIKVVPQVKKKRQQAREQMR